LSGSVDLDFVRYIRISPEKSCLECTIDRVVGKLASLPWQKFVSSRLELESLFITWRKQLILFAEGN
jgi:hypothetical protein